MFPRFSYSSKMTFYVLEMGKQRVQFHAIQKSNILRFFAFFHLDVTFVKNKEK